MQFTVIALALFSAVAIATPVAEPAPQTSGSICFDDGDCLIFNGGGTCTRSGISIVGTCVKGASGTGGFSLPSGLALPFKAREAEAEAQE